jgi:hypothetical protein
LSPQVQYQSSPVQYQLSPTVSPSPYWTTTPQTPQYQQYQIV